MAASSCSLLKHRLAFYFSQPDRARLAPLYRPCDRHGTSPSTRIWSWSAGPRRVTREAFGELVERNRRAVFRAALAAVGSATEADDVAQEAFVTAFQKLDGFRGEASFRTWLLSITWRKAIDRRKSVTRWMQRLVAPAVGESGEEWDPMQKIAVGRRGRRKTTC